MPTPSEGSPPRLLEPRPMPSDPTRPGVPVLPLFLDGSPVFWPLSELALLREEWEGRLEATAADGRVAHLPGPYVPGPPLHALSPGVWMNPAHARRHGEELALPGGWRLPAADLPPAPRQEADPTAVLALLRRDRAWWWVTGAGESPGPATAAEAQRIHPDLVPVGDHLVRPGAVRGARRVGDSAHLVLEGGRPLRVGWKTLDALLSAYGLPWPDPLAGLSSRHRLVYEQGLRDWPAPLLDRDGDWLRREYGDDPVRLLDHVIWEVYRCGSSASDPRGVYYNPLKILAARMGLLQGAEVEEEPLVETLPAALRPLWEASLPGDLGAALSPQRLWEALQDRFDRLVGEARVLTFADLRFVDRGAGDRRLGGRRPHVVLLVEKGSLERDARVVAELFDCSMLILGGFPTWIGSEFFARALGSAGPVLIVGWCDFDPYGWLMPEVFRDHLDRYGVATSGLVRLVKPHRFTPEERRLLAEPLSINDATRKLVGDFVAETGGVDGLPLGLYADFFRPVSRPIAAMREETGLEPFGP